MLYPCPCCGCLTLHEAPPGSHEICSVCFWEDDRAQFDDENYAGGANRVSLAEARANYRQFGACEERFAPSARGQESS